MSERFTRLLSLIDEAVRANPGYDQGQRWTWLDKANRRIIPGMEADCSAMSMGLVWLAGYPIPDSHIDGLLCWTGNVPQLMAAAGWHEHHSLGLTVSQIQRMTGPGDVLLGDGHVMIKHRSGLWWSMNQDENGNGIGGRRGDQTGVESSLRPLWARHGGWIAYFTAPDKSGSDISASPALASPAQNVGKFLDHATTERLQHVLGVASDGVFGPQTAGALIKRAGFDPNPPRFDTPSSTIKTVQKYLNQFPHSNWRTYPNLAVDGLMGPATGAALSAYLLHGNGGLTNLSHIKL